MLVLACVVADVSADSVACSTRTDIVSTVFDAVTDTTSSCAIDCADAVFETDVSWSVAVVLGVVAVRPAEIVLWLAVVENAAAGAESEPSDAVVVSCLIVDGSVAIADDVLLVGELVVEEDDVVPDEVDELDGVVSDAAPVLAERFPPLDDTVLVGLLFSDDEPAVPEWPCDDAGDSAAVAWLGSDADGEVDAPPEVDEPPLLDDAPEPDSSA